ncbi:MAG: universal stress protein, partial [Halobacteriales archaeon]
MPPIETVLAPTDCSSASATAVEYAVAVADRYGAALHLLQVLDERVVDG